MNYFIKSSKAKTGVAVMTSLNFCNFVSVVVVHRKEYFLSIFMRGETILPKLWMNFW
jgi:hypothetical protein